ncbi:MAG: hypothetical protein IJU76_00540, partial [Desulfovibrionaceae bacterium]|nr:hypothetical protein [Desulfovibrionaceae bacterium]
MKYLLCIPFFFCALLLTITLSAAKPYADGHPYDCARVLIGQYPMGEWGPPPGHRPPPPPGYGHRPPPPPGYGPRPAPPPGFGPRPAPPPGFG